MGEQIAGVEPRRAGGGEHGYEDAEAEGAAEPVGDVDQPGGRTGVLAGDAGDARRGERAQGRRPARRRSGSLAAQCR